MSKCLEDRQTLPTPRKVSITIRTDLRLAVLVPEGAWRARAVHLLHLEDGLALLALENRDRVPGLALFANLRRGLLDHLLGRSDDRFIVAAALCETHGPVVSIEAWNGLVTSDCSWNFKSRKKKIQIKPSTIDEKY